MFILGTFHWFHSFFLAVITNSYISDKKPQHGDWNVEKNNSMWEKPMYPFPAAE
jgi:hypothetical protein